MLDTKLVSWCFRPSQPQRITSGLIDTRKKKRYEERKGEKKRKRKNKAKKKKEGKEGKILTRKAFNFCLWRRLVGFRFHRF